MDDVRVQAQKSRPGRPSTVGSLVCVMAVESSHMPVRHAVETGVAAHAAGRAAKIVHAESGEHTPFWGAGATRMRHDAGMAAGVVNFCNVFAFACVRAGLARVLQQAAKKRRRMSDPPGRSVLLAMEVTGSAGGATAGCGR